MRFFPLILANLGRKKVRTALTIGSFAVALFLFGLLVAIHDAFGSGIEMAGADRLFTISRVSLIQPLPVAYRERILRAQGVSAVSHASWFGGVYQDEKNFIPQFAIVRHRPGDLPGDVQRVRDPGGPAGGVSGRQGRLRRGGEDDLTVLWLVLGEICLMAGLGGASGLALAKAFSQHGDPTQGMLPVFYISPEAMAAGLLLSLVAALMAGLLPALSAIRLSVIDAMRRV